MVLSALTARMDEKPIFIARLIFAAVPAFRFILLGNVWTARFWRPTKGITLGDTYMPYFKILSDHLPPSHLVLGTSYYTATHYLAAGLSYFSALEAEPIHGWH
jgi:hypothetical protein